MKIVAHRPAAALLAAVLMAGPAALATAPAAIAAETPKPPKLSKQVMAPLAEAQKLQGAGDQAGALAKIKEAEAFASPTADDTYTINALKLNSAIALKDNAMLEEALTKMLATGKVSAADQPKFYKNIGALALQRKDYATATGAFEKLNQIDPNNGENKIALAELYYAQKQHGKAVETLNGAIAAQKAAGQVPPENWYRRALGIAYDGKQLPQAQAAALALVEAYPNPVNWRDALVITRDAFPAVDDQTELDFLRLQAATNSLNGERDFVEYADTALGKGYPGEAQFAINEGIKKGMLSASKPLVVELKKSADGKVATDRASLPGLEKEAKGNPKLALGTADAYYGYGDYAKAAALYGQAAGAAGVDANTANLRMGASLARAGDKAGAQKALNAVKGGPREALAKYWLAYLNGQKA